MPFTQYFLIILILTQCMNLGSHGFGAFTYVKTVKGWESVQQVAERSLSETQYVISCEVNLPAPPKSFSQPVAHSGMSETSCYFRLGFDSWFNDDILCTPTQEFYAPLHNEWIPAYKLRVGDILLSEGSHQIPITHIEFVEKALLVYALEIEKSHTFLVGRHSILTHNIFLPIAITAGLTVPFGAGAVAGGTAGGFFGPVTFFGGCIVGGMIGLAVKAICNKHEPQEYQLVFTTNELVNFKNASGNGPKDMGTDAQAPGKPTEEDVYVPPKNWDGKKVRNPNGPGYGYPDKKDKVWIPTGPNGHGCPHWDVEDPDGSYENIVPGGRRRGT